MDKQSNRKKRRARGEGVTSYRVTSSLSLTDQAYEHQQRLKQQRATQGPASADYPQDGYYAPQTYTQPTDASPHGHTASPQGHYDQQAYADPNQQGYYDQQAYGDPNQQGY
ncbi:MAG: hypothetical protein IGS03_15585, partial [Candidatus Sericytochromatia bacterium]|nr:hypothetical protein [Candidatus Sericytochromatia bacterium]